MGSFPVSASSILQSGIELGTEAEGVDLESEDVCDILREIDRDDLADAVEEYVANGNDSKTRMHSSDADSWQDAFREAASRHI